ncbi:polyribonucleotide nucleotidyltransferase [Patescibacteria group bacterium]|nr:polyribonucleotide nucleotidyltransferase [Patescibacteria group bacterium]
MNKKFEKSIELGGRKLTLSTGVLAQQATAAVMASYGDTVVLATVVAAPLKADLGYFPLTVEYQERLYAGGRIKGSRWVKREGRPTDEEILSARVIDRSIRPLFPHEYNKKEVQVFVMVLSVDLENDPSILSAVATSAALAISPIPWNGPIAVVRVGIKDEKYVVNPLESEKVGSGLDLVVSSTKDGIVMVEAAAKEVPEEKVLEAMEFGQKEGKKVLGLIGDLVKAVGIEKEVLEKEDKKAVLTTQIKKLVGNKFPGVVKGMLVSEGGKSQDMVELILAVQDNVSETEKQFVPGIVDKLLKEYLRGEILKGKRPDGRKVDEVRPLSSVVGVLPRTHGSAIFQRGQTQALTVTTLGAPSLAQLFESAEGEESKRYMHHYSMPPYSVGETGRVGFPNRREIGHGALAEKALEPVIPSKEKFPYTIRVVSEIMASNGSSSMASVCGSTLSLMDAGVPLTSPVSGIAMGIIYDPPSPKATAGQETYVILSDIMGLEDFNGDMDLKVAGTSKGITVLQMDVKALNLTPEILGKALLQAKEGRAFILKHILETIKEPRKNISAYAPKIKVVKVPVEKIGEVIGPWGRVIKKIIAETGAEVEVEDDGSVNISGTEESAVDAAVTWVEGLVKEVAAGEIYEGEVKRIQSFGAFIEILPGKEGMVHVSDMGENFVNNPEDVVSLGQKVQVRVKEIDDLGRINLSMNMDVSKDKPKEQRSSDRGPSRGGYGGGRPHFAGGSRGGGFSPSRGGYRGGFPARRPYRPGGRFGGESGRSSGPHFPTSRLLDEQNKKDFNR